MKIAIAIALALLVAYIIGLGVAVHAQQGETPELKETNQTLPEIQITNDTRANETAFYSSDTGETPETKR